MVDFVVYTLSPILPFIPYVADRIDTQSPKFLISVIIILFLLN